MRWALLAALLFITAGSAYLFVAHPWWFPAGAIAQSATLDHGFNTAFLVLGSLFIAAQVILAIFLVMRNQRVNARFAAGDWRLEIFWTVAIAALFFAFNISGAKLWSRMMPTAHHPRANAIQVEVTGTQFQWYFRYPGPDGTFGHTDPQKFARAEEGNPLGVDPNDPPGRDDILSTTLVLPAGENIDLHLRAQDVIHSLFIPAMRYKQDAVPGMEIHSQLYSLQAGTYEIACAELCGTGHYRMRAQVRVVSPEQFSSWLKTHEPRR